ncbi:hypothetical protein FRC09_013110 [Ceratobasidium sp. 395]|nr:hypothetical protein FRC09_013110 [Ceratobasidium sp. 395]
MIRSALKDAIAARSLWEISRLSRDPDIQQLTKALKAAEPRKPEWGRPIDEYIHDTISLDDDALAPNTGYFQLAIDTLQILDENSSLRPTCNTFTTILRLFQSPENMPMLIRTRVLSSCVFLLREHIKDTQKPVFYYEYGYLCFQVMILTIQVAMLSNKSFEGFNIFSEMADDCLPRDLPWILSMTVTLALMKLSKSSNRGLSWVFQTSHSPQGRITVLPDVGGINDIEGSFLISMLWNSRKEMSYIVSKAPTPGWKFLLRMFTILLKDSKKENNESDWGYLENLCHRYGLGASEEDLPTVTDVCGEAGGICTDGRLIERSYRMEDEEDARTVVESYIARMTPDPNKEPLPQFFCSTLIDFVFGERISTLGETLLPMLRVGYERIWLELADEKVARDVNWGTNLAQLVISTMGSTERLFGAEHRFKSSEIEAFVSPLHDVDIVGLLGQALLLPTNLPPHPEVDAYWVRLIKSAVSFTQTLAYSKSSALAARLFADEHSTWLNTLNYIRSQVLHNPDKDESLRANAQGTEIAWMNVGKIFGFTEPAWTDKSRRGPFKARGGV